MRSLFAIRLTRAGFGLLAVWCLGCTSFDVVVDAALNGAARAGCVMEDDAGAPVGGDASVVQSAASDERFDCCCDHCRAVETDGIRIVVAPHAAPETIHHELGSATSVSREPLVPPPIALIAI